MLVLHDRNIGTTVIVDVAHRMPLEPAGIVLVDETAVSITFFIVFEPV